jgi:hypothetical protein
LISLVALRNIRNLILLVAIAVTILWLWIDPGSPDEPYAYKFETAARTYYASGLQLGLMILNCALLAAIVVLNVVAGRDRSSDREA